jgi:hypothetical protein
MTGAQDNLNSLSRITVNEETSSSQSGSAASISADPETGGDGVKLIAVYHFILAGLFLLGTVGVAIPALITGVIGVTNEPNALIATMILTIIGVLLMTFTLLFLTVGYGLWTRRQWARIAAIVLAILALFAFPIGTFIGALIVWYLIKPEVVAWFDG